MCKQGGGREGGAGLKPDSLFVNIDRCGARGGARGGQVLGRGRLRTPTGGMHVVTRVAGCGAREWRGVVVVGWGVGGTRGNGRGDEKVTTGAVRTFCCPPATSDGHGVQVLQPQDLRGRGAAGLCTGDLRSSTASGKQLSVSHCILKA